jgi:hypothetical protein
VARIGGRSHPRFGTRDRLRRIAPGLPRPGLPDAHSVDGTTWRPQQKPAKRQHKSR